nr:hypothetical protein [Streptomyces sp. RTd22]
MARIRTIKPEAFISESLAEVSVNAERTFFGLLTQADDQGRFRDNPAIINGLLWPLRAEHTAIHAEDDLQQLADAGLICRYTGCDGRRYLHVVTWADHQKIDKPSPSRLPSCPAHHPDDRCGACKAPCTRASPSLPNLRQALLEPSSKPRRTLLEFSTAAPTRSCHPQRSPPEAVSRRVPVSRAHRSRRTAPHRLAAVNPQVMQVSGKPRRTLPEEPTNPRRLDLGSWILDLLFLRGAQRPHWPRRPEP